MKFRRLLILAGLLGVGLLIIANLKSYGHFAEAIGRVDWYVFPLVGVVQLVSYYCNAKYYQTFFALSGLQVPLKRLYQTALAINFANQAIPSGGIAGATYISQALSDHVPAGKATLAQLFRYVFTFISFILVLSLGFIFLLFFGRNIGQISVRVVLLVIGVIILIGLLLVLFLSDRSKLRAVLEPVIRFYNRLGGRLFGKHFHAVEAKRVRGFFDEFYAGVDELWASGLGWLKPLAWALGGNLAEVATIYVVFLAFGRLLNPGIVIVAYTLANMASLASIFTSGIGVYEATMIGAFASLGVPVALSFSVVVVYRVINLSLFLPPGFYYYRRHLQEIEYTKTESAS